MKSCPKGECSTRKNSCSCKMNCKPITKMCEVALLPKPCNWPPKPKHPIDMGRRLSCLPPELKETPVCKTGDCLVDMGGCCGPNYKCQRGKPTLDICPKFGYEKRKCHFPNGPPKLMGRRRREQERRLSCIPPEMREIPRCAAGECHQDVGGRSPV